MTVVNKRKKQLRIRELMQRVRSLMLQGMTNQTRIAELIGTSQPTAGKYMQLIWDEWLVNDIRTTQQLVRYRIEMLSLGVYEGFNAWERSKKSGEQLKTTLVRQQCILCKGEDKKCKVCGGSGEIVVENVVKTVTGQVGDSNMLRIYMEGVRDMAKLEGLYAAAKKEKVHRHQHEHIHSTIDWDKVPAAKLLQVMQAHQMASESVDMESADTIDADSDSIEENEE